MSDDLDPLPPLGGLALRALSAERARGDVDPAMQERILGRVVASVAIGAAVTGVAATAHAAGATGAAAGTATGAAATGAAAAATGLTLKTLPWILAAFVVGGGVGAAVHAAVAPSSPVATSSGPSLSASAPVGWPAPVVLPPAPSSASPAEPIVVPVGALPSAPSAAAVTTSNAPHAPASATGSTPSIATAPSGGADVDLAAERSLVDRARTALGRGQSSDALAALDAHAARYPHGRLSEEREALAVEALARSGRMDLALARAARFRTSYPNSVFRGVVDAALVPR
jgi:hypothetical protein